VEVIGLSDAIALADTDGGPAHICAIRATGAVVCWGGCGNYACNAMGGNFPSPVTFGTVTNVAEITLGTNNTTCWRHPTGEAYCIGNGGEGQMGDTGGFTSLNTSPRRVAITGNIVSIAAGYRHACAVAESAGVQSVWCWGADTSQQRGEGPGVAAATSTPQRVMGLP
jgi:hypothetical protein